MIQSDNHIHTSFSADSDSPMESMIQRGIELNLSSLCFTEHMDYGFPSELYHMDFQFPVKEYFETIQKFSLQYPQITLRTGVELGLKKDIYDKAITLAASFPFDFIIGSTHLVDNIDPYYPEYWEAFGEENGIRRYYETTYENLSCDFDFDVYGHIDYIIRYCPSIKKAIANGQDKESCLQNALDDNWELICEILKKLIDTGKGIEVNTGGLKAKLGHPNPHERIITQYKKFGGEIITVGSDAHEPAFLAHQFEQIPLLLVKCGFSSYTEFKKRKPIQIPLS